MPFFEEEIRPIFQLALKKLANIQDGDPLSIANTMHFRKDEPGLMRNSNLG